ncbi:MAG: hypothetical protein ACREHD_14715 [Pirellulales bacterium]
MDDNPYQPPTETSSEALENGWYTNNATARRYGELWHIHKDCVEAPSGKPRASY